ncbi:MAG: 3-hydroxyacyl-CoA dehydrogenase family protein [Candidatus Schekmanbacteria bacterium]|nr:3-hydroxyacyl-CoA dehydrogenase family protein [Candidatus Schekmanbacteria bacterium]
MEIKKIGVAGLGIMGSGITVTAVRAGLKVIALEVTEEALANGKQSVEDYFAQSVKRGKMSVAERTEVLSRVSWTTDLRDMADSDAIIEAVNEDLSLKSRLFKRLNDVASDACIFITNTSTLSVTKIASASGRSDRVIGIHFCNPAPLMELVEIAVTPHTSKSTLAFAKELAERLGKVCVVNEDAPGHIVNVLLMPLWADAVRLYEQKIATAEDIDTVCRIGFGHPKGPLEMIDIAGTSITATVLKNLYEETGEKRQRCPRILEKMASAGMTGRKSGTGFYKYKSKGAFGTTDDDEQKEMDTGGKTDVKKLGVVGFGTMGMGIAQTVSEYGIDVVAIDTDESLLKNGIHQIEKFLARRVAKGVLTQQQANDARGCIKTSTDYFALAACDLVVEAVFEKLEVKQDVFRQIEESVRDETVIASNTSCIPLTEIAAALKKPARACGLHFFNPVPLMNIVEIVRAMQTSETTLKRVTEFAKAIGRAPVFCKDMPGFISNRLLIPYLFQAYRKFDEGLASVYDIDRSMELGAGFPMGPFMISDLIGLDVLFHIGESMYLETADRDFAPPPVLRRMIAAGYLGRKSGRGFYEY